MEYPSCNAACKKMEIQNVVVRCMLNLKPTMIKTHQLNAHNLSFNMGKNRSKALNINEEMRVQRSHYVLFVTRLRNNVLANLPFP